LKASFGMREGRKSRNPGRDPVRGKKKEKKKKKKKKQVCQGGRMGAVGLPLAKNNLRKSQPRRTGAAGERKKKRGTQGTQEKKNGPQPAGGCSTNREE